MSVKGGVYAHEAYDTKKKLLCEYMGPTSFLYINILLACNCYAAMNSTSALLKVTSPCSDNGDPRPGFLVASCKSHGLVCVGCLFFKDTEPSPSQDSFSVRQQGGLPGPPPRSP